MIVSLGKEKGGLEIKRLDLLNRALLGKWAWRFAMEENSTWKSCISAKYGSREGEWFTPLPRGNHGVGLWKFIAKEFSQLKKDYIFKMGMVEKSDFGKTIGVEVSLYVKLSLFSKQDVWVVRGGLGA